MLVSSVELLTLFVCLELSSFSLYLLVPMREDRKGLRNQMEASIKYILYGVMATGVMLFGMSYLFGLTGTTYLNELLPKLHQIYHQPAAMVGIGMVIGGFLFKLAVFPFHFWVPDVYQGSPTTVAGLFSTVGKAAAFSAIIATLHALFNNVPNSIFSPYLSALAVFSMLFGSIVAIAQTNIKRMLAYSSISHAGYMLIGLAAGNSDGVAGVIFYLTVYTFMNLAAFGIVSLIEGENDIDDCPREHRRCVQAVCCFHILI